MKTIQYGLPAANSSVIINGVKPFTLARCHATRFHYSLCFRHAYSIGFLTRLGFSNWAWNSKMFDVF